MRTQPLGENGECSSSPTLNCEMQNSEGVKAWLISCVLISTDSVTVRTLAGLGREETVRGQSAGGDDVVSKGLPCMSENPPPQRS